MKYNKVTSLLLSTFLVTSALQANPGGKGKEEEGAAAPAATSAPARNAKSRESKPLYALDKTPEEFREAYALRARNVGEGPDEAWASRFRARAVIYRQRVEQAVRLFPPQAEGGSDPIGDAVCALLESLAQSAEDEAEKFAAPLKASDTAAAEGSAGDDGGAAAAAPVVFASEGFPWTPRRLALEKQLEELQRQVSEAESNVNALEAKEENLRASVPELAEKEKALDAEISAIKRENTVLEAQQETLDNKLAAADKKIEQARRAVEDKGAEVAAAEVELRAAQAAVSENENSVEQYEARFEKVRTDALGKFEIEPLNIGLAAEAETNEAWVRALVKTNPNWDENGKNLQDELLAGATLIEELEEFRDKAAKVDEARETYGQLSEGLRALEEEAKNAEAARARITERPVHRNGDEEVILQNLEKIQESLASVTAEKEKLQADIEEISRQRSELSALQARMQSVQDDLQKFAIREYIVFRNLYRAVSRHEAVAPLAGEEADSGAGVGLEAEKGAAAGEAAARHTTLPPETENFLQHLAISNKARKDRAYHDAVVQQVLNALSAKLPDYLAKQAGSGTYSQLASELMAKLQKKDFSRPTTDGAEEEESHLSSLSNVLEAGRLDKQLKAQMEWARGQIDDSKGSFADRAGLTCGLFNDNLFATPDEALTSVDALADSMSDVDGDVEEAQTVWKDFLAKVALDLGNAMSTKNAALQAKLLPLFEYVNSMSQPSEEKDAPASARGKDEVDEDGKFWDRIISWYSKMGILSAYLDATCSNTEGESKKAELQGSGLAPMAKAKLKEIRDDYAVQLNKYLFNLPTD